LGFSTGFGLPSPLTVDAPVAGGADCGADPFDTPPRFDEMYPSITPDVAGGLQLISGLSMSKSVDHPLNPGLEKRKLSVGSSIYSTTGSLGSGLSKSIETIRSPFPRAVRTVTIVPNSEKSLAAAHSPIALPVLLL
jgi:hypothetical protein